MGETIASGMVGNFELDLMGDDDIRNRADVSSSRAKTFGMVLSPV